MANEDLIRTIVQHDDVVFNGADDIIDYLNRLELAPYMDSMSRAELEPYINGAPNRPQKLVTAKQTPAQNGWRSEGRDRLFLSWSDSGMTPAQIRDQWNMLSQRKRDEICPENSVRISMQAHQAGADTVKKIIRRTRKKLGNSSK